MAVNNCEDICVGEVGPFTADGTPVTGAAGTGTTNGGQCITGINGTTSCPAPTNVDPNCRPWQLTTSNDACLIAQYASEALAIAGAKLNVYKLLGVHEQGKLLDVTGQGSPMSNGDLPGHPASFAFDKFATEWRSIQKGAAVAAASYIGYDFGVIKRLDKSPRMYGIEANVRKHITTIIIKQSANAANRVTTARFERSDDNMKWYGVGIIQLPDDDCLNTVYLRQSVPSRYWRLRPIKFGGGASDSWSVQAFQMIHIYTKTYIDNIQDKVLIENRDRSYSTDPLTISGSYQLSDISTELSKFGIELPTQVLSVQVSFTSCVALLGRPLVIGDIIEMPSEAQYSAELKRILKWMEVTDVGWSSQGYTPGWTPTLLNVTLQPAYVSQETQDIFGDLHENPVTDGLGLVDRDNGEDVFFQDYFDSSQTAQAEAKNNVPEKGAVGSATIRQFEQYEIDNAAAKGVNIQKLGLNPTGLFVEDAMPPNNAPFTEGVAYPPAPKHGDYHRLTYTGLSKDIPASLHRFSGAKNQWIFLETDKRALYNPDKPVLQEFLTSPTRKQSTRITK